MAKVRMHSRKRVNKTVANLPGVRRAVDDAAKEIKGKAEASLAAHRLTGDAEVSIETKGTDAVVSLTATGTGRSGPYAASLSIEFGHDSFNGKHVEGLHILSRAAGLL